jgi:hypothetical protein
MRRTLLRATEAALLATVLLTPPAAFAQDRSPSSVVADAGRAFSFVWSFLEALFPGGVTPDNRCGIDPNGRASCEPGF